MVSQQLIDTLKGLGVNALEAEVYCELLKHNGVTAYRLAKLLNKATANVYKSVKVLAGLGGIMIQQTNKELCHAIDPEIFLSSLNSAYQERCLRASKLLNENRYNRSEEGIYHLDNAHLAIQQAKKAIDSAHKSVVIDAFPKVLGTLKDSLTSAIKRGVNVCIQSYDDTDIEGANIVKTFRSEKAMDFWKTEQLNMVIDGRECLICLFNNDLSKVIQAMWSRDLYLACVLHVGLSREHFFQQLKNLAEDRILPEECAELIGKQDSFILNTVLGQKEMEILLQSESPSKNEMNDILEG